MTKRSYGDGGIYPQGKNTFRLRYRVNGKRYSKTIEGSRVDAKKELRALLRSGDTGEHVAPDKAMLAGWAQQWIEAGAPGRNKRAAGARAVERYEQLLRTHVLPTLGERKLQQIHSTDIDKLYLSLEGKIAPRTARHVHSVLNACLGAAVRTRKLAINPMERITKAPSPGESDHGIALDDDQLRKLVQGFKGSSLFGIVSLAAFTGARRNEILALRWSDIDVQKKELRIERAIEETKAHGVRTKGPKKESHKRTIMIDDDLLALLLSEREKHLRMAAGIPDGATVDLGLIKLPDGALMFPNPPALAELSFVMPRHGRPVSREFRRKARQLGFNGLRFHDLRGTHETLLLDRGVPVHVVAARCGHDPAELLRTYAKRTRKADNSAAAVIGSISKGILGN
jgi:integrase